jgi:hypothetical protein
VSHAHLHVPHELTESEGAAHGERVLELAAVLLLSLTTLATAWSGYQAARWSGEQSALYARASALRVQAEQQHTAAGQLRIDDLVLFDDWLDARTSGNERLAAIHARRFRPAFRPAFRAWLAQRPLTRGAPVPGPLYMPQYRLPEQARGDALEKQADARSAEGTQAKVNGDRYVLSTVFFAAVLFFAGISLRLEWLRLRVAVIALAGTLLLGGAIFVISLPVV